MTARLLAAGLTTLAFAAAAPPPPPLAPGAKPIQLAAEGAGEGPAWHDGALFFSGGGKISRWQPGATGGVTVFRDPSGGSNGLRFDREGRLIVCEAGNRRVTRIEKNGEVTVLADNFEGRRFNTPNDLALDSRGRIYFSDPRYGKRDGMELDVEGVYRIDAPGKVVRILGPEVERANGVLVSPDDRYLYVADNNNNTIGGARKLWRFALQQPAGTVAPGSRRLIFDWKDGRGPDGVKMDGAGRLFVAGGLNKPHPPAETGRMKGGVYVLSPAGKLLDFVPIPRDEVTNCAFGGADGKTLFITAGGSLWSIATGAGGSWMLK
ncbi:MAG: SMP-30/gluconolactonase/LRE family protein [Bryobacterales bacterium]|nr:SMP-30/gluconolactonase/LRE family protein [Bryobacterales bacterium]